MGCLVFVEISEAWVVGVTSRVNGVVPAQRGHAIQYGVVYLS